HTLIVASGRVVQLATLTASALTLTGVALFIGIEQNGALGAAWAMAISQAIYACALLVLARGRRTLLQCVGSVTVAGTSLVICSLVFRLAIGTTSGLPSIVLLGVGMAFVLAMVLPESRRTIVVLLRRRLS